MPPPAVETTEHAPFRREIAAITMSELEQQTQMIRAPVNVQPLPAQANGEQ